MGILQTVFDANAIVVDKLDKSIFEDGDKANVKLAYIQSVGKSFVQLPFLGVCGATKLAAKKTGRPLDTSKLSFGH